MASIHLVAAVFRVLALFMPIHCHGLLVLSNSPSNVTCNSCDSFLLRQIRVSGRNINMFEKFDLILIILWYFTQEWDKTKYILLKVYLFLLHENLNPNFSYDFIHMKLYLFHIYIFIYVQINNILLLVQLFLIYNNSFVMI